VATWAEQWAKFEECLAEIAAHRGQTRTEWRERAMRDSLARARGIASAGWKAYVLAAKEVVCNALTSDRLQRASFHAGAEDAIMQLSATRFWTQEHAELVLAAAARAASGTERAAPAQSKRSRLHQSPERTQNHGRDRGRDRDGFAEVWDSWATNRDNGRERDRDRYSRDDRERDSDRDRDRNSGGSGYGPSERTPPPLGRGGRGAW
jgi:hypothetical protein